MHSAAQFSSSFLIGLGNEPFLVHALNQKNFGGCHFVLGLLVLCPSVLFSISFEFHACSPSLCGTALLAARCGTLLSTRFSLVIRISVPENFYSFVLEKCQVSPYLRKVTSKLALQACTCAYMSPCTKSCILQEPQIKTL